MAPSSTRIRSRARASSAVRFSEIGTVMRSGGLLRAIGANAEQMADGEHEAGAVHGVEVKGIDAAFCELLDLAGHHGCRDQLAGIRVVAGAFDFSGEPVRHGGAGAGDEITRLFEIVHRHDAGHDGNIDTTLTHPVEVTQVEIVIEEYLRDG